MEYSLWMTESKLKCTLNQMTARLSKSGVKVSYIILGYTSYGTGWTLLEKGTIEQSMRLMPLVPT